MFPSHVFVTRALREVEKQELRPFHETIVEMIRLANPGQISSLGRFLKTTCFQKNHGEIIEAWNQRREELARVYGLQHINPNNDDVVIRLLAQKQAAEVAASDLGQSFAFDGKERALMIVVEKIINVCRNLHWHSDNEKEYQDGQMIFKLLETGKKISRAQNEQDFRSAIAELKS